MQAFVRQGVTTIGVRKIMEVVFQMALCSPKCSLWESKYSVFGDNPIFRIDPKGDKWKERSTKDEANKMKGEFESKKTEIPRYR